MWLASNQPYDAIVLDIMLPKLNGYQVCIEIRKRGIWAPVLMLTAKDGELDEAEALDSGADDFVRKPFSFVVLLARLRALTRRGSPPRPVSLEVGDIRLDPAERRVHIGSHEVMLTPTEFAVLDRAVVEGDAGRLGQLVRNLTDNAARHAASKVWLELSATDGVVELLVSDDGPGIPEEDRERVFDRFVRLDDSRSRDAGGSGLGLALARSIARSHGGELTIVASRHGGATLQTRLPNTS